MKTNKKPSSSPMQIVILDRGWVYVGLTAIEGDWLVIREAQNIRIWGTTRGLGQLAIDGPQSGTKLDPAGTVRSPLRAVIATLDVEAARWTTS